MLTVKIIPNERGNPPGKLADVELHFVGDGGSGQDADSVLNGLKLIGFAVWEQRTRRSVTFPARQYSVNGEWRSFALLRPIADTQARDGVRQARRASSAVSVLILDAYAEYEQREGETR